MLCAQLTSLNLLYSSRRALPLFSEFMNSIIWKADSLFLANNSNRGDSNIFVKQSIQAIIPGMVHQNVNILQLPESKLVRVKLATNSPNS